MKKEKYKFRGRLRDRLYHLAKQITNKLYILKEKESQTITLLRDGGQKMQLIYRTMNRETAILFLNTYSLARAGMVFSHKMKSSIKWSSQT